MRVQPARYRDVRSWLDLAAEVEPLFGPMLDTSVFYEALLRNIGRGTAFCVREGDGPPGTPLLGCVLLSPRRPERPEYRVGSLAVAEKWRRRGVGRLLVEHVFGLVEPPATLAVVTFGEDVEAGNPRQSASLAGARRFYEAMGFQAAEALPPGDEGGSRQMYRREFPALRRVAPR